METQPNHLPKLTSSEISSLWSTYINSSLSQRIMNHFLKHVEDDDIRRIIELCYNISLNNIEYIKRLFSVEKIPIPIAFTDEDVYLNAPRLYTDMFMLSYLENLGKAGMIAYGGGTAKSYRKDIRNFFSETLQATTQLYNQTIDISASKGILVRPPYVNYPSETKQVDTQKYISGLSPFNKKRPLNIIEISYLHENIQTNLLGAKLALSFA